MESFCFMPLINLLGKQETINSHTTYFLLELYTKMFKSNDPDMPMLKLNVIDMLICADK